MIEERDWISCKHLIFPDITYVRKLVESKEGQHFMLHNEWEVKPNGDLVNINQEKLDRQNSAATMVLKRLGTSILRGKNIMSVSLPVQLCN